MDIALLLQGIQQQLTQLAPMNAQLTTLSNKVAYLEAKEEDSDYYNSEGEDGEAEGLEAEANQFFIGESGKGTDDPKGRGRRKGAGVASRILKGVRKR